MWGLLNDFYNQLYQIKNDWRTNFMHIYIKKKRKPFNYNVET